MGSIRRIPFLLNYMTNLHQFGTICHAVMMFPLSASFPCCKKKENHLKAKSWDFKLETAIFLIGVTGRKFYATLPFSTQNVLRKWIMNTFSSYASWLTEVLGKLVPGSPLIELNIRLSSPPLSKSLLENELHSWTKTLLYLVANEGDKKCLIQLE